LTHDFLPRRASGKIDPTVGKIQHSHDMIFRSNGIYPITFPEKEKRAATDCCTILITGSGHNPMRIIRAAMKQMGTSKAKGASLALATFSDFMGRIKVRTIRR
jgi:hypothetical protein